MNNKDWKIARVASIPKCDFCTEYAHYDAKLKTDSRWAYFCEALFITESHQRLGLGLGQRLVKGSD